MQGWGSVHPRQALHDKRVLTSICHVRILSYTLRQQDIPFIAHDFFFLKKKKKQNSLMLPSFLERRVFCKIKYLMHNFIAHLLNNIIWPNKTHPYSRMKNWWRKYYYLPLIPYNRKNLPIYSPTNCPTNMFPAYVNILRQFAGRQHTLGWNKCYRDSMNGNYDLKGWDCYNKLNCNSSNQWEI